MLPAIIATRKSFLNPSNTLMADLEPSDAYKDVYSLGMGFTADLEVSFCPAFAFMLSFGGNWFTSSSTDEYTDDRFTPVWTYDYHYADAFFLPMRWGGRFRLPIEKSTKEWFDSETPGNTGSFLPYIEYMVGFSYLTGRVSWFIDPYDWNSSSWYGQRYTYWEKGQFLLTYSASFGVEFKLEKKMQMFLEVEYAHMDPPETSDDFNSESEPMVNLVLTFGLIIPL